MLNLSTEADRILIAREQSGQRETMVTGHMNHVIQRLRRAALVRDGSAQAAGQLLETYLTRRDEAALEALLARHGPMVWGVCRRVLGDCHDAEDAFQATFLVFVRKATSVTPRAMLANWLYGVAHQTALNIRTSVRKRHRREQPMANLPEPPVMDERAWREIRPILDEEMSRLPDRYRVVIVMCDLEGKTRKEAAHHLHCPEGTVAGRLARARGMLAKRLAKRGVAITGAALATLLVQRAACAGVPHAVMTATMGAASLFAAGNAAALGVISPKVVAATEGVLKAMMMSKLKVVVAVALALGFVVAGASVFSSRTAAGDGAQPTAEAPAKKAPEEEAFTAWGKEFGGLQAGLGFRPGQKRAYSPGTTVPLVVRVRNVGRETVTIRYHPRFFLDTPPAVTDDTGKQVSLSKRKPSGADGPVKVTLAPGKEAELYELKIDARTGAQSVNDGEWTLFETGKFQVQYERLMYRSGKWAVDPTLGELATGKLEVEINADAPEQQGTRTRNAAVQDIDPEKIYRAMETKVRAAKSLQVALVGEVDAQANKGTLKATIYAAEGNQSRMEIDLDIGDK